MRLRNLSKMSLLKNNKVLIYAALLLGFLGFLDAAYLTILHYQHTIPPCTVTNGCETVLTSSFSTIYGVPIALPGVGFYLAIIALSLLLLTNFKKIWVKLLLALSISGVLVSLILVYVQFGIIGAWCQYCVVSEVLMFLIFVASYFLFRLRKRN